MKTLFSVVRTTLCLFILVVFASVCTAQTIQTTGTNNHDHDGVSYPWNISEFDGLKIGTDAVGDLTISGGATVNNLSIGMGVSGISFLGSSATGIGTATISGTDSLWHSDSALYVGQFGTGELTMTTNSKVTTGSGTLLGTEAGSNGTAEISSGAHLDSTGSVTVGNRGTGMLTINAGGKVSSSSGSVGNFATAQGTAFVTGTGALWELSSGMRVGNQGTGDLTIQNGAQITTAAASYLGHQTNSNGTATVKGNTSKWTNASSLTVGEAGTGTLTISDRGVVTSSSGTLGEVFNGIGTANVDGANSHWDISGGDLSVGNYGRGELNLSGGGQVSNVNAQIGVQRDGADRSEGIATITGEDSHWQNTGNLLIGVFGDGTLNVEAGGLVSSATGVVGLNQAIGGFPGGDGTATIKGTGSRWENSGDLTVGFFDGSSGELNVQEDGALVVGGKLTVNDPGIVNLSGGLIDVGTLELASSDDFNMSGGRLSVDTIIGDFEQEGGTFAPGDSPGLTDIQGDYNMQEDAFIEIEIAGLFRGTNYDAIDVSGVATLDGTLDINWFGGFEADLGDTFFLVGAGTLIGNPTFDFDDADLEEGLMWDTSSFLSNGSISVAAVPEPASAAILVGLGLYGSVRRRKRTS